MSIKNTDSLTYAFDGKRQAKDSKYLIQSRKVFKAFRERPKTMLMVSVETGVLRANICRYVAEFRKLDSIEVERKSTCEISNHRANFYTTNPDIIQSLNTDTDES